MKSHAPQVVDWFRLFVDLARAGLTTRDVGAAINVAQSTLMGWKLGASPKWDEGERLIALWCSRCARDRADLSMAERALSAAAVVRR